MIKGVRMPLVAKEKMIKTLVKVFSSKSKPIIQYTKKGEVFTIWKSLMEIERLVGKRRQHVRDVCLGRRKSAYGFIWKYVN
jgi:hypothetical protein